MEEKGYSGIPGFCFKSIQTKDFHRKLKYDKVGFSKKKYMYKEIGRQNSNNFRISYEIEMEATRKVDS